MIYPIPLNGAHKHSLTPLPPAKNTSRRRRWSLMGLVVPIAMLAVATMPLAGLLLGMSYVTEHSPSSESSKRVTEAMIMPVNSPTDDGNQSDEDGISISREEDQLPLQSHSNDREKMAVGGLPIDYRSDAEHIDRSQSDKDDDASSRGNIFTEARQFFNNQNLVADASPSHSLRSRQIHFPRTISIEGNKVALNHNLRGESGESERRIYVSKQARKEQARLMKSRDFSYRDPLYEGDCVPMQKWQETSFPNCNLIHELDFRGKSTTSEFEYYAKGGYNHIFWLNEYDKENDPELVMKILQYGTSYSDRNFDRVRRDGLILERLTQSPYVLDIYGFCGFDVLTPYADGGTLSHELSSWGRGRRDLSPRVRLKYAVEVAAGLADVHDIDKEGLSSVSHGDLKGGQYLFLDGVIKLGDFNRGRFLRRNSTAPDKACTYTIGKNDAAFRSPEEYEYLPQTSAIDVWALGSILYQLLTGKEVWHDTDTDKAQKYIRKGKLPRIDEKFLKSKDPVDVALREAINMCYIFDPKERAKASDVASFLRKKFSELPKE
mmetsp:Transcript_11570/g.24671  ORF Transcript_11570/g.24671 Transcript_11570/m.24671 type:complete len:548 (-) Transcript_11570:78-1721(-)